MIRLGGGLFLLVFALALPGISPIRAYLARHRVDGLCQSVNVGERFDYPAFRRRAIDLGMRVGRVTRPESDVVLADDLYFLRVSRMCWVELSGTTVKVVRNYSHAP